VAVQMAMLTVWIRESSRSPARSVGRDILASVAMPTHLGPFVRKFHENAGYLSTNLLQDVTGVDGVVWIFMGEPTRNETALGPRIFVVPGARLAVSSLTHAAAVRITIPPELVGTLPPRLSMQAASFAAANRSVLQLYWLGEMGTQDALDLLVRV
jgi:hypothetical protein